MANSRANKAQHAGMEFGPRTPRFRWLFVVISGCLLLLVALSAFVAVGLLRSMHAREMVETHATGEHLQDLSALLFDVQQYNSLLQGLVAGTRLHNTYPEIEKIASEIEMDVKRYPSGRDANEAAIVDGLQNLFVQERIIYVSVITGVRNNSGLRTRNQNVEETEQLQNEIFRWFARLKTWSVERLHHTDDLLASELSSAENRLRRALLICFASGFLLLIAGTAYIARLEHKADRRYRALAQSEHKMQQLSTRLVDAQETERRTISRELHDEVGQSLGALLVEIGRLSTMLSPDRSDVRAQLDKMKSVAERTFQEVRNIALLLRPSMLDDLGLVAALEWQGREVSRRSGLEVDVQSDLVSDDMPDEYRVCIYRLVQEALNNAVRHSGAKNAKVTVHRNGKGIRVQVADDGHGFDPSRERGLGLLGMEERVERLGGNLTIESESGAGASVTALIPLPEDNGTSYETDTRGSR